MASNPNTPVRPIVLLGPTAGGKSELAVHIAERFNGEIISADSMQVYRHMDAGTAKPGHDLRARAPHHLIDIVEPTDRFTVADWLSAAEPIIDRLIAQGRPAVVVGGTNLYLKALLEGMFEGPDHDPVLRAELDGLDNPALHARLQGLDEESARRIHPNDRKKMVRAIEVTTLTGIALSKQQTQWDWSWDERPKDSPVQYLRNPILIGLHWPVEAINKRINLRVKLMFKPGAEGGIGAEGEGGGAADMTFASTLTPRSDSRTLGLVEETKMLLAQEKLGMQAREALGYKQVIDYLQGRSSLEDAFETTKILTRRFAKTQRTWLKRYRGVTWLDPTVLSPQELVDNAMRAIETPITPGNTEVAPKQT
jgi:tRNA dimethylallyltransferase